MSENFEEEFSASIKAMEKIHEQIESDLSKLEISETASSVLHEIYLHAVNFDANIQSLYIGFSSHPEDITARNFFNGTVLTGIISAYENFSRRVLITIIKDAKLWSVAQSKRDSKRVWPIPDDRLNDRQNFINWAEGQGKLNDPRRISKIMNYYFHIPFPEIANVDSLIEIRNAFSHHGGCDKNGEMSISNEYVTNIFNDIESYADTCLHSVNEHYRIAMAPITASLLGS